MTMQQIRTHLMFDHGAEEAMRFYVGLMPGSEVRSVERYTEGDHAGILKLGHFTLGGVAYSCADSPIRHEFGFTPAFSIFVDVESREELERLHAALGEGGQILMPLDDYGFSAAFTWVSDRFGVSWQLNLPYRS